MDESNDNGCKQNEPLKHVKCRFDYPLPINGKGMCLAVREYLLDYSEVFPVFRYKLIMNRLHKNICIYSHIQKLVKNWQANMDL